MDREEVVENLAGDLEYHPRRGVIYLLLGVASLYFWISTPHETKFGSKALVFFLGSLTLLVKGIFLFRKSSEGFGLSEDDYSKLSESVHRKPLPTIPNLVAQLVQDFGAGPFLLFPLLFAGKEFDKSWIDPPMFIVFATGAILFWLGWGIRYLTEPPTT